MVSIIFFFSGSAYLIFDLRAFFFLFTFFSFVFLVLIFPCFHQIALQRLKEAAEKAKKELSAATTTNINLPFITATAEGPNHFDMNLTRGKFDELAYDLVERTAIPVQNALKDAGLTAD